MNPVKVNLGITLTPDTTMPSDVAWDYYASVKNVKAKLVTWKTVTVEILHELWVARETLGHQGARTDLGTNVPKLTWERYCGDVGMEKRTANRWLLGYDPVTKEKVESPVPDKPPLLGEARKFPNDAEYERKKAEWEEEVMGAHQRPLGEIFDDIKELVLKQEKDEIFRDFDVDGLIDELRRRVIEVADIDRRHEVASAVIKAMREIAAECDRMSARAAEVTG